MSEQAFKELLEAAKDLLLKLPGPLPPIAEAAKKLEAAINKAEGGGS